MGNGESKLILGPQDIGMTRPQMKHIVFHREPIQFVCECKQEDTIALPRGEGILAWRCDKCDQHWKLPYGPKGGELQKAI